MRWSIEYFSEGVQDTVLNMPPGLLARYIRLIAMMSKFGSNLGMPHTRAMSGGLFELRVKGSEGLARVFYCTLVGQRIVILHSFIKKSQKTPAKELKLARHRMNEVKSHDDAR